MIYLDKEDVCFINRRTVEVHGGNFMPPFNYLHEESLDYLLNAVQADLFGEPMYPILTDKAAVYCYSIIGNHIFSDGNKRTGLEAALAFLKLNGMRLDQKLPQQELFDFVMQVASGQSSLEACRAWFAANAVRL
ncbi:type II toxin-antitoxin system death-on-curing family toxin [Fibrella sp. WM1]|uniref:type II toxin-antitoxin system death-on-curing family toxin n=1 Tax=Fibrella musci TaxID=3242485 RepID=UPI003522C590